MAPCPEFEALLQDDVAGELAHAEHARLAAHLSICSACAEDARTMQDVLGLAALTPPSQKELAVLEGLEADVRTGLRKAEARRVWLRRTAMALFAAAAAVLLVVVPRHATTPGRDGSGLAIVPGTASGDVERWALSDSLTDPVNDPAWTPDQPGQEESDLALADPQTNVDLFLNPGE